MTTRATPADIFRIYRQLWGTATPELVESLHKRWGDSLIDETQKPRWDSISWRCPNCRKYNEGCEDDGGEFVVCPHCDKMYQIEEVL